MTTNGRSSADPAVWDIGSDKVSLPSEFGSTKALLWKTDLPLGHGSPCIWGDRIFVTAFNAAANKPEVIAVTGKTERSHGGRRYQAKEVEKVHEVSSPATSTPVTDGEHVYVYNGSYGILAYDLKGKVVWEYPMELSKSPYGSGTSPVLAGDLRADHTGLSTRPVPAGDPEERWETGVESGSGEVHPARPEDCPFDSRRLEGPDCAQPAW